MGATSLRMVGWGHPFDRPAADVLNDVLDGFVSQASALRDYGVMLQDNSPTVDEPETRKLRGSRGGKGGKEGMFHRRGRYYDSLEPLPDDRSGTPHT